MKKQISILLLSFLLILTFGCEGLVPSDPVGPSEATFNSVDSGMASVMNDNAAGSALISSADVSALLAAGKSEVKTANKNTSTDAYEIIPIYVRGMQSAIPGTGINGNELAVQAVNEMILKAAVAAAETASTARFARATASGSRMAQLISNVSAEIYSNLQYCGIDTTSLASTAKSITILVTDALISVAERDAGISENELPEVIATVVEAGVASTVGSGLKLEEKQEILGAIVQGAAQSVSFYESDYDIRDAAIEQMAAGAIVALVNASEGLEAAEVDSLLEGTMQGVASGLDLMQTFSSGEFYVEGIMTEVVVDLSQGQTGAALQASVNSVVGALTVEMVTLGGSGSWVLEEAVTAVEAAKVELALGDEDLDSASVITDAKDDVASNPDTQAEVIDVDNTDIQAAKIKLQRIANNNKPVITVPDNKYTIVVNEGEEVTLSFSASDADPNDSFLADWYFWDADLGQDDVLYYNQLSYPYVLIDTVTFTPMYAGEYEVTVWVYESICLDDGTEVDNQSHKLVFTVVVNSVNSGATDAELAEKAIDKGLNRMFAKDFSGALSAFAEARQLDPDNNEAKLWWSFMYLAETAVDPAIVGIANDMGLYEYPTDMTDLLDPWGDTMNVSIDDGEMGYNSYLFLPKVKIPAGYLEYNEKRMGDARISLDVFEYSMILMRNLLQSNPNGLNSVVDSASNALSARVAAVKTVLTTIPDDALIAFTRDTLPEQVMLDNNNVTDQWPTIEYQVNGVTQNDEFDNPIMVHTTIDIGRAEIDVLMSTVDLLNTVIHLFKATSFDAEVNKMYQALNPIDGAAYLRINNRYSLNPHYDWSQHSNPFAGGALQARADAAAIIADAESYFLSSMKGFQKAVKAISARTEAQTFFFGPGSPDKTMQDFFKKDPVQGDSILQQGLKVADILFGKIIDSVEKGTVVILPADIENETGEIDLAPFTVASGWPDTVSYGKNMTPGINFSKLFDKALFDINNFIELDENFEPVFYQIQYNADGIATGAVKVTSADLERLESELPNLNTGSYGMKIPDLTLGGLIQDSASDELIDFIDAILGKVMRLEEYYVVKEADGSFSMYTSGLPAIAPYITLAPAGTPIFRDDLEYVYRTTGSFWTGMFATQEARYSNPTPLEVGTLKSIVLDKANDSYQEYFQITLDVNKKYVAVVTRPDYSVPVSTSTSFYASNVRASRLSTSSESTYDVGVVTHTFSIDSKATIVDFWADIYQDSKATAIPAEGYTVTFEIQEVVEAAP